MKGTITRCLAEMVEARFGLEEWQEVVASASLEPNEVPRLKMATADIDDASAVRLFLSAAKVLELKDQALFDAFGEHWCCVYAPRVYAGIIRTFRSAREMLLGMDAIHVNMTASMRDSRPPRFEYEWIDDDTLRVTYKSSRNLIGIFAGLTRGVATYFGEQITVAPRSANQLDILFS